MGTINSSLTYSYEGTKYSGFDYELGKKFAAYLNVELRIEEYDTLKELFAALDDDKIDFIGAGLTLTPKRAKKYRSSPPYYHVSQKVVYHKGTYRPRKLADVNDPIAVLAGSSHQEKLESLSDKFPDLKIDVLEDEDQESLLRKVAEKEIKYAIVNSSTLAQKQRYYPVLAKAFTISKKLPVAWLIKRNQDDTIYSAMIEFIGNKYQDKTIAKLEEKYFGHVEQFDFVDTRTFLKRIKTTLPKYEALFRANATPEVHWSLLAAVSYQESHWNPRAKSPTGVRGMMMLTIDTAKYIGITNRLDAKQSIEGGAKYLSELIKRLPDSIAEDEKVWFALASYNIGYGHLMDARRITKMKKQNPNAWSDVKDNLPLLHEKQWYKKTLYGYARGREAQHYVNNIRQYRNTLTWFVAAREKEAAEQKAQQIASEKALSEQQILQKALAAQQALQKPLSQKEALLSQKEALQKAQEEIQAKEKALQQAQQKTRKMEDALQKAEQQSIAAENALQEIQHKILAEEDILQQAKATSLAQQQALQTAQEKAFKEEKQLQQSREKTLAEQKRLQEAYAQALAELTRYQQAKKKALAEQQNFQQAKDNALNKLQKLQADKDEEQQELEDKV